MANKIEKDQLEKSLKKLQGMAKGQLFNTGSDSNPGSWAGTSQEEEDSYESSVEENGTDYNGVKKALAEMASKGQKLSAAEVALTKGENPFKLIASKVSKGQKLTAIESWCLKAGAEGIGMKKSEKPMEAGEPGESKDAGSAPQTHAGSADDKDAKERDASKGMDDDEDEDKTEKSLSSLAEKSPALNKGIELSPFLAEFVAAMDIALRGTEERTARSVVKALHSVVERVEALEKSQTKYADESTEFNKSLAEAVIGIGQQVSATSELAQAAAQLPARAPKSQLRAVNGGQNGVIQKSFEGNEPSFTKGQIVNAMVDAVTKGKLDRLDVIKYEHTGELSQRAHSEVMSALGGSR